MGRRWQWVLRPGRVAIDLTGQVVSGEVPGRYRRRTAEGVVPDALLTSRCDGTLGYERPERRRAAGAVNRRAERYGPTPPWRAEPAAARRRGRADG